MTDHLKDLEDRTNLARTLAARTRTPDDLDMEQKLQYELKREYAQAEEKWRLRAAKRNRGNPRHTWGQIREWLGWKGDGTPKQLQNEKGQMERGPRAMANIMSDYYATKVRQIRSDQPSGGDPL